MHSLAIVHDDLNCVSQWKCQHPKCLSIMQNNVLLDADYTARLADFGYASLVGYIPESLTYLRRSTTRPGTFRWTAPEQVLEEASNRTTKSDIYSFGCVSLQESPFVAKAGFMFIFLQVLSGKQPWSEVREEAAVVLRMTQGHKPGRPESRPVDDMHWDLIEHCWTSVQERPAAEAIISSIQRFLSDYPPFPSVRNMVMPGDSSAHACPLDSENDEDRYGRRIISAHSADMSESLSIRIAFTS